MPQNRGDLEEVMSSNHRIKNLRVQNLTRIIEIVIDWSRGLSALCANWGIGGYLLANGSLPTLR